MEHGLLRRHWPKTNWSSLNPMQRATQALGYVRPLEAHTGTKRSGQLQGRPGGQQRETGKEITVIMKEERIDSITCDEMSTQYGMTGVQ